ncbi:MAG: FtsQ-type POTRA domain-containing protein [Alphaproteobacteria bacterium]|nr:FtsQ-type POTRA domain-containing protein [Alphaproteobacteria bacterium]MBL7097573.1 FtsQ-type POTRA domain-containing protein [Alphaproteobacteria bacterium]
MRSVKIDRKASQPRTTRAGRGNARASRPQPSGKPFGKRKPLATNIVARSFRAVRSWFALHRLMFTLTAIFMAFVFIAALFIGGTVGRTVHAVNTGIAAVVNDAGFGIAEVHLVGNKRTPTESIMAALDLHKGQPIFGADVHAARARVMQLPWVADAEVRRRYPNDISARIIEKLPYALWQSPDGKVWVVERDGGLITTDGIANFRNLPTLFGLGGAKASDIVEAVAMHRAVSARIKAYERVGERRWNLILDDGVVVQLPEANWAAELDALEHLIIDKGILERDVGVIDLRSPSQYFFVLKSGEKTNEPRGNGA